MTNNQFLPGENWSGFAVDVDDVGPREQKQIIYFLTN